MYQWRPSQWIKWAPLTILPFVAGAWLQTGDLVNDVVSRAQAAAGDNAKIAIDGRDITISGQVTSEAAKDNLLKAVRHTYGVRSVDVASVKVVAPIPLMAPTVESITTNNAMPEIKGTWPNDVAKTLAVDLNGKTYELNKDAELQATAGNWTLKPTTAIPDGQYDVTATVSDGATQTVAAAAPGKIVIDTVAPSAPVIAPPASDATWPYAITGTWPEAPGSNLSVKLADKVYNLGKDDALKSDGAGNFTFDPKVELKPGSYDLNFKVSDAAGNITEIAVPAAIVVAEPPAPAVELPKAEAIPMAMPSATAMETNQTSPALTGTYPKEAAKLTVDLDGKTYELGKDKELSADGAGNWTLKPATLADGDHTIISSVVDAAGTAPIKSEPQKIVVDTVAPAAPTMSAAPADAVWPYAITGTWPEATSAGMIMSLAGQAYVVNKDKELVSDGNGNFTFMPSTTLAPGKYDIYTTVVDKAGNSRDTVMRDAIVIAAAATAAPAATPAALDRPTVNAVKATTDHPMVSGTWPAKMAKNLTVDLDGTSYVLGTDPELTSDADGQWMLMSKNALANGTYNVVAHVSDDAGQSARDATQGELVVEAAVAAPAAPAPAVVVALAAPTVETSTSDSDHPTVKGTWPADKANGLIVALDGTSYKLGTDFDLSSNAAGNWTLTPKKPLVNGTYDVIVQITDAAGQTAMDTTKDELVVNVAPPPPAPPPTQPYDCVATLARISAVFPVRFEFNKDSLATPYDLSVNQYSSLLKDARCLAVKVQVAGHADYKGTEAYNQGLSERRAKTVIDALVAAGITADRLTGIGYSKDRPLDPALDDSARMKNRRVEFTIAN